MRRLLLLVLVGLVAVIFTACGSDDSSKSDGGGGASKPAASGPFVTAEEAKAFEDVTGLKPFEKPATAAELKERVAKYTATPTELLQTEPVSKKAEPGKRLAILYTGVPIAIEFFKAKEEAAKKLGWRVTGIDIGTSPEDFAAAYDRAIGLKPDMVIGSGLPREYFDKQLTTLEEMNTPVIEWSSGVEPVEGHLWVAADNPLYQAGGIQMSEFIAADSDLKAQVVAFSVKQFKMIDVFVNTMDDYFEKMCTTCSFDLQQVAAADIGKLGDKVTAYIQKNPDTNYVLCGFGDLCQGVGTALKSAGRDDIKILSRDPATTNYQNIKNDVEYGAGALPIRQTSYQVIDLAQRIFNGDDTSASRLMPQQIITKIDDPKSDLIGAVPDFEQKYEQLWQLGG